MMQADDVDSAITLVGDTNGACCQIYAEFIKLLWKDGRQLCNST